MLTISASHFKMKFTLFTFLATALASPLGSDPPLGKYQWRTLAPIPSVRQEHVTVPLPNSSFAILGGIAPEPNANPPFSTTNLVQIYSIPANTWRTASPMPLALNHPNAVAIGSKIYLLGGLAVDNTTGDWVASPRCFIYSSETDSWKETTPMPSGLARGSAAMGVYKENIFLAGGMDILQPRVGGTQGTVSSVIAFNTKTEKWITDNLPEKAKNLPQSQGRDHAGAAVIGHTLFVLGGRDHGQENVKNTVFALDLQNLAKGWVVRNGTLPTARGGLAAAAVGNKVFTFGGEGNKQAETGVFDQTEVYDVVKDKWERLPPMKLPRHGTSAVAVGGKIYIPGGGTLQGGNPVDTLDVFERVG